MWQMYQDQINIKKLAILRMLHSSIKGSKLQLFMCLKYLVDRAMFAKHNTLE